MTKFIALLCVYILTLFGVSFSHGFYTFGGMSALLCGFILLTWINFKPQTKEISNNMQHVVTVFLSLCVVIVIAMTMLVYGGIYQANVFNIPLISRLLLLAAMLLSLTYVVQDTSGISTFIKKKRFIGIVCIMFLVQLLMIVSSPEPKIDIFYSLKYGGNALLKLENPYQATFPQVYEGKTLNYFSYFPTVLGFFSFFNTLSDPRLGIIAAHILATYLLFKVFAKKKIPKTISELVTLLFLYYPLLPFITEQSFTDSLSVLLCTLLLYCLVYDRKRIYTVIIIVLLMNVKQLYFILMPLFFFKAGVLKNIKDIIRTYLLATLPVIPFLILSWRDFIYDTVLVYLLPPQGVAYNASLNMRSFLENNFYIHIDPNILFMITLAYLAFLFFKMKYIKETGFYIKLMSQFFFGFFLLGGFAYLNHYFLVSQLIVLYAACLLLDFYNSNPGKSS